MKKKILSTFISLCMVLGMIPATVFAAESDALVVDVMDAPYNAKGNGANNDREAIQAAIDDVYAAGGGTVVLTAGKTFWSGNIILKSNVTLQFGDGAVLKQSSNPADFVKPSGDGYVAYQPEYGHNTIENVRWGHSWYENYPLVYVGEGTENVKITGNGTIEMTPGAICDTTLHMCPVGLYRVNNFEISDITITKCSNYGMMPYHCNNGLIKNIKMNEFVDANGDGISLQNCQNIRITGCNLSTTDDTIYIFTSYQDPRGGTWWNSDNPQPSKNIEIDHNVCETTCKGFGFILWGEACPNQSLVEASNVYIHDNDFCSMGIWYNDPFVNGTDTSTPAHTPIKNIRFENNTIDKIQSNFYETEISDMNLYQSMTRIKNGDFEDRESYWVLKENEKAGSAGISKYSAGQQGTYMGYIQNLDKGDAKIYQGLFFQKDITYTFTANVQTSGDPVRLFVRNLDTQELIASKEITNTEWTEETLTFKVPEKGNYHIGLERGNATSGWARIDVASVEGEAANGQSILTSQTPTKFDKDTTYELGTRFKSLRAGKITKVRIYTHEQESGIHTIRLWDQSAKKMIAGPYEWYVPYGTTGWQEFKLPTPVGIEANKDYVVAVSNNGTTKYYPIGSGDDNSFKTAISNGYLTTYASSGLWSRNAGDMPYNKTTSNYFRDVVFVPDENSILTTQVPDSYGSDNTYELGTLFQTKVAGKITKVRLYTHAKESGVHTVRIWDQSTKTVLAGPYEWNITAGTQGWQEYELPEALSIKANTSYVVSVSTGEGTPYYAKGSNAENSYSAPILNGDLVTYASSGLWYRGTGTMPYNRAATNYFRDIVFVADKEETSVDLDKSVLEKKILAATGKTQGNATDASWSAFQAALANAQSIYANESATQNEVDVATASLQAAVDGMIYQQILNAPTVSVTGDGSVALSNASGESLGATVVSGDKINVNVTIPEGGEVISLKVCKSGDLDIVVQEFDVTEKDFYFLMPTYEVDVIAEFTTLEVPLKITSATLQLENDITVLFKTKSEMIDNIYTDVYVVVTQELEEGETKSQTITGVKSEDGSYYEFKYTGVAAKEVGDLMDITIYGFRNGELVTGETKEDYGIMSYCLDQLEKNPSDLGLSETKMAAFKTLLVDIINYASEAQSYFGYKTDALVAAQLSDEHKVLASADSVLDDMKRVTNPAYETIESPSVTWNAATLQLLSRTTIRVKVTYGGSIENIKLYAKVAGKTFEVTKYEAAGTAGVYYFYFDEITAFQFGEAVDFYFMEGDTVISNTARYSVESYAMSKLDDATVGDVVSAMMKYGKAAMSYRNAE